MSLIRLQNYIGGELVDPQSGEWLNNVEPATGEVYSEVPDSNRQDIDLAVSAAQTALPTWSSQSVEDRASVLFRLADAIDDHRDELIRLESQDNGKPEWLARVVDIPRCSKNIRHFASTMVGYNSESHAMKDAINFTLRQPLGVVGVISPWNLPLYLFTWKIAPALATGNCVIGKPSEVTPMTAFKLGEICVEAGLPPGVLNIVHGSGAKTGNALLKHSAIKAISFTGGTQTGKHVASVVSPQFKKLSLELGGKNPNIIFDDCDYAKTLQTTVKSSFSNQGQICLCGSRIFVQRKIYDQFRIDFVAETEELRVGDPRDPKSNLGAVVSEAHFNKILSCIDEAKNEGGNVLIGGRRANVNGRCENGFFVEPTVIEGLPNQCTTNQQEIFGPVVTLQPFDTEQEVVGMANDTEYGLSASVWTQDISRANRVAKDLETGVVWVNCWLVRDLRTPFGGVKQSGMGREGGEDSLRFFTQTKNVCIQY